MPGVGLRPMVDLTTATETRRTQCASPARLVLAAIDYKNMKTYSTHVADFASAFTTTTNRLGNESLKFDGSMDGIKVFLGGQVTREGEGEESTVSAEILEILSTYFTGKVSDLPPVEDSDALLKRVNGWNKRPEKAAANGELRSANSKLLSQKASGDQLMMAIAHAEDVHGKGSPEYTEAQEALQSYMMANLGK